MESTLPPESPESREPISPDSVSTGSGSPDRDRDLVALSELETEFVELERELERVERSGNDEPGD